MSETILPTYVPFIYTGIQRYIRLTENVRRSNQYSISRCFILDEQLSIISKKGKEQINLATFKDKKLEEDDIQQPKISYIIKQQPRPILFAKQYEKYPQLSDFQIGRDFWGRTQNCLKIPSDHISRDHTRIQYKDKMMNQQKQQLKDTLTRIISKARCSSNWRKLPRYIWELIIAYAIILPYYTVQDCGSRNGTFLIDFSKSQTLLTKGEIYQFEEQQYKIQIDDVVITSGNQIAEHLRQFQQRWNPNMYQKYHKKIITSGISMDTVYKMGRVHAIHFQIVYAHQLKYFFWIVNQGENDEYFIGEGQEININAIGETQNYDVSRHGKIVFENGKWTIVPINPAENIWYKLKPNVEYELDVRHKYKIRIGHLNTLDLQFFNYFP